MEHGFKIGDKVKVKDGFQCETCRNKIGEVIEIGRHSIFPIKISLGNTDEVFGEGALEKVENFKIGDTVKIVKPCDCSFWNGCVSDIKRGNCIIIELETEASEDKREFRVEWDEYSRCRFTKDQLQKENSMSQYETVKAKIDAWYSHAQNSEGGWDKDFDDILQEIIEKNEDRYYILISTHNNEIASIDCRMVKIYKNNCSSNLNFQAVMEFAYDSQCEKLTVLRDAASWLLDNSEIKKSIVDTVQKIEIKGKIYKARIIEEER